MSDILNDLTEREARIADAACRRAYDKVADWLTLKQVKAEQFPGANKDHAKGCASAYQNAAQEVYGWALKHAHD